MTVTFLVPIVSEVMMFMPVTVKLQENFFYENPFMANRKFHPDCLILLGWSINPTALRVAKTLNAVMLRASK